MQNGKTSKTALLTCFFSECESRFHFLKQDHGYSSLKGLTEYRNNLKIIKPYQGQEPAQPFSAIIRYERKKQAFEINYGDKDDSLEFYIYFDSINRLTLSDILSLTKKRTSAPGTLRWIKEPDQLKAGIKTIATTLETHIDCLTEPSPAFIEHALISHEKRLEHAIRKQYKKDMLQACKMAAKAYRQQEYIEVVRLLKPFEKHLGLGALKKLILSRKKIIGNYP